MFRAWVDPEVLKRAFSPVTALVDDAKVRFENGGLRIKTVDAANVGAVSLDLLADAFHSYDTNGEEIGLNIRRIDEIVRSVDDKGQVLMELDNEEHCLILEIGEYRFRQPLLLPEATREGHDPYELETAGRVKINSDDLSEAIQIASMFSEQIKLGIDASREIFYMIARGDTEDMHLTLDSGDLIDFEPVKSYGIYSLAYLNDLRSAFPRNSEITLGLGQEYPLKIQYSFANDNGRITYGLAPRIEN